MKRILFVCLGNICRSSSAEEVMRTLIKKKGLEHEIEVDSAGILSYHRGELPDSRMRMHASRRGYNLTHRSRPDDGRLCRSGFTQPAGVHGRKHQHTGR